MRIIRHILWIECLLLAMFASSSFAQLGTSAPRLKVMDSGGPILREQAAYDVTFYRLGITIDTTSRSIVGSVIVRAVATEALSTFVLDLDSRFTVASVVWRGQSQHGTFLQVTRSTGRIWISLPFPLQKSDTISVEINYYGTPKVSTNPPWDDGFVWKRTRSGEVWAGVACETEGGDVWWPCKDHPSDEADSVDLYFNVPASLTCVSNGRLLGITDQGNTKTFHWYVSNPINNYNVTFYLGPFQRIPVEYRSVTGEFVPAEYWFLPENVDSAKKYTETFLKDLRFFEEVCGPFPFRADKYALADAPYWGMEHQTIVAYGNNFRLNAYGFDYIHLHELAHEWWGNLVTAKDWSDLWIHEGFATYMEALFVERQSGFARYKSYMASKPTQNTIPLAPNRSITAQEAYKASVYNKGAWVIHSLRYYVGDQIFFRMLRRFAYPDSTKESLTDGRQCRLGTVEEFRQIAEQVSGKPLGWFFTVYLRQAGLPQLTVDRRDTIVTLRWIIENNVSFPMPVEVQVGSSKFKVNMDGGSGTFAVPIGASMAIDPDGWILMALPKTVPVEEMDGGIPRTFEVSLYPNPFNPTTTLRLEIPKRMHVHVEVISLTGEHVAEVVDLPFEPGTHTLPVNLQNQSSGVYFVVVRGDEKTLIRKVVLLR